MTVVSRRIAVVVAHARARAAELDSAFRPPARTFNVTIEGR